MADEPTPQEIQSLDQDLADPETAYDIDDIAEGLEQSEESIDDFFREQEELLRTETARALEEQQIFLEEQENASDTTEITDTRMSRWLDHARTDHQAQGMAVAVKQEDRKDLTADALIKLQNALFISSKFLIRPSVHRTRSGSRSSSTSFTVGIVLTK